MIISSDNPVPPSDLPVPPLPAMCYYIGRAYAERGEWWNGFHCRKETLPLIQADMAAENTIDHYIFFELTPLPHPSSTPSAPHA